jgi:uncharacterized membrane protein YheB (UPF0754 family)
MAWLLLIPLTEAFACWLVFKLFITFPFHPVKPISIAGIKIQGILPAKQKALANRIGKLVAENFFSADEIGKKITDPANLQKIMPAIEEHIDDFLRNKLKKEMPVISMFIGDKTVNSLKQVFMNELQDLFPQIMSKMATNFTSDLNIAELVTSKISSISLPEIEKQFRQNFSKELRLAGLASASIGLLIGFIAALIIYFTIPLS